MVTKLFLFFKTLKEFTQRKRNIPLHFLVSKFRRENGNIIVYLPLY